ncbi:MAG: TetR/AcrR family transcriptional regulator [Actinomycetota bacterium]|jgi:AcrR family transcriptional regulator|nr:TetR/AcrR family transcriptional regulator [Actinomycetota bacterium]
MVSDTSWQAASEGGVGRSDPARRLLGAADDLFYRQGAAATTVREITGACGLTPGALYNHFTSKEDLLYDLVVGRHRLLDDVVVAELTSVGDDPVDRLTAVVRVYVEVHVHARQGSRVANREYPNLTGPRLAEVVAIRRRLRDRVMDILAAGAAQGRFDICGGTGRASVMVAAATILDMCIHATEWLHEGGPLSMPELQERYVAMALRIVGASPSDGLPARPASGPGRQASGAGESRRNRRTAAPAAGGTG